MIWLKENQSNGGKLSFSPFPNCLVLKGMPEPAPATTGLRRGTPWTCRRFVPGLTYTGRFQVSATEWTGTTSQHTAHIQHQAARSEGNVAVGWLSFGFLVGLRFGSGNAWFHSASSWSSLAQSCVCVLTVVAVEAALQNRSVEMHTLSSFVFTVQPLDTTSNTSAPR